MISRRIRNSTGRFTAPGSAEVDRKRKIGFIAFLSVFVVDSGGRHATAKWSGGAGVGNSLTGDTRYSG